MKKGDFGGGGQKISEKWLGIAVLYPNLKKFHFLSGFYKNYIKNGEKK